MADPLVDLISLSELQAYLQDSGLSAPTDIEATITGVSAAMQSYANTNFVSQSYTFWFDGPGGPRKSLPNKPITSVSAVTVDGVSYPASTSPTSRGFIWSDTQVLLRGGVFTRGLQNCSVSYTAGFAAIPGDIKRACCEGVGAVLAQFQYGDPRAIEMRSGGTAIKLGSLADYARLCLTANVTAVLDQRKRIYPA